MSKTDKIVENLFDIKFELESYACLFRAIDEKEFQASLYGLGNRLRTISDLIEKAADEINALK